MNKKQLVLIFAFLLPAAARAGRQEDALPVDDQYQTREQVKTELEHVEELLKENKRDMKERGLSPEEKEELKANREKLEEQKKAFKQRLKSMKAEGGAGFTTQ